MEKKAIKHILAGCPVQEKGKSGSTIGLSWALLLALRGQRVKLYFLFPKAKIGHTYLMLELLRKEKEKTKDQCHSQSC